MTAVLHNCILHLEYVVYVSPIEISFLDRKKSPAGCYLKKKTHYLCIFKNAGSLNQKGLKCQITFSSIQYFSCKSDIIGFSILQEKNSFKDLLQSYMVAVVLMLQFLSFFSIPTLIICS